MASKSNVELASMAEAIVPRMVPAWTSEALPLACMAVAAAVRKSLALTLVPASSSGLARPMLAAMSPRETSPAARPCQERASSWRPSLGPVTSQGTVPVSAEVPTPPEALMPRYSV